VQVFVILGVIALPRCPPLDTRLCGEQYVGQTVNKLS